jgi:hypothetical protein
MLRILAVASMLVSAAPAVRQPKTVALLDYKAAVPVGWTSREPSSSMRLAEFVAGAAAPGAPGAEVVVYFFGPGQGGTVEANLARWKGQFSNPDGGSVSEGITHETSAFPLTVAEYRGTYARGVGVGSAPEAARPNHVLVAVVAETPKGTIFFQLFGPAAAVAAQRDSYLAFVRGLK